MNNKNYQNKYLIDMKIIKNTISTNSKNNFNNGKEILIFYTQLKKKDISGNFERYFSKHCTKVININKEIVLKIYNGIFLDSHNI